jgi:hypothetical protein
MASMSIDAKSLDFETWHEFEAHKKTCDVILMSQKRGAAFLNRVQTNDESMTLVPTQHLQE